MSRWPEVVRIRNVRIGELETKLEAAAARIAELEAALDRLAETVKDYEAAHALLTDRIVKHEAVNAHLLADNEALRKSAGPRIAELEAALDEAAEWIGTRDIETDLPKMRAALSDPSEDKP